MLKKKLKGKPLKCWGIRDRQTGKIDIDVFKIRKEAVRLTNLKFYKVIKVKICEVK